VSHPLVSVLLPVRDAGRYLLGCRRSLEGQTFSDFEVVAVDDGSRDGSGNRLRRWARRDPRVRVLEGGGRGLVTALNQGLAACRGELVARMDADDAAPRRRLQLQVETLRLRPELGVIAGLVTHFPRWRVGEGYRVYEQWLNGLVEHEEIARERFIESPVPHPAAMVRRQLLEAAGGYRDRGWPEDYDLWLRLFRRGVRFAKVPRVLHFWRDHPERLTRVDRRYAVERFLACKAHHLVQGPLQNRPRVWVWGAGQTGRRLSKHLLREGVRIEAFVDIDPRKVGGTLRRRPVVGPDSLAGRLKGGVPPLILAAVASRGARSLIRERLGRLGLEEGRGFWCVA
jgi:glycosyltransferase involved in cell wall biosynthesis